MPTEDEIEKEIQEKGLTAPRITPEHIDACIVGEAYFTAADGVRGNPENEGNSAPVELQHESLSLLTICVLVLRNGFTVVGTSACASPENFNFKTGCKIARDNAREKIWQLEGYALKDRLAKGGAA